MCIALAAGADLLCSGVWKTEVFRDQEALEPLSGWTVVCRHSGAQADYLELQSRWQSGVRIERHLLVGRNDRCVLLADALLCSRPGCLVYRGWVPLGPGVKFRPARPTCEGALRAGSARALVLPLALPEWRQDGAAGTLACSSRALELCQAAEGKALFAPLWFDLARRPHRTAVTWRQLTVAENLAPVRADQAVGYRIRVGRDQWLVYRSLSRPGNRTVLGHNLVTPFLVARFSTDGLVRPLLEIEAVKKAGNSARAGTHV